jgi:tRNA A37 methylthiotransferase MiaB
VTGCYAELNPQAVAALPGVNLVVGNRRMHWLRPSRSTSRLRQRPHLILRSANLRKQLLVPS